MHPGDELLGDDPGRGLNRLNRDLTTFWGLSVRDCRTISTRAARSKVRSLKPGAAIKRLSARPVAHTFLLAIQDFVYYGRGWFQTCRVSGQFFGRPACLPLTARREAGHQLDQLQNGREPDDWKPMNTVGRGAKEIRIRDEAGAFRVLYVAKFADAVYVLHCFQKKTGKTSKADVEIAAKRYRELLKELG